MQVGVLDSVVGGRDELDRFERARSVGCTGIEVMLLRRHLRDAGTPAALRAAQAATGLELPTFVLDEPNLGGLIRRVHVKDLLARKNDCHPGLGRVDFGECAAALAEIGYDGWLVLETPAAPLPVVARDVTFTHTTFGVGRERAGPVYGAFA